MQVVKVTEKNKEEHDKKIENRKNEYKKKRENSGGRDINYGCEWSRRRKELK